MLQTTVIPQNPLCNNCQQPGPQKLLYLHKGTTSPFLIQFFSSKYGTHWDKTQFGSKISSSEYLNFGLKMPSWFSVCKYWDKQNWAILWPLLTATQLKQVLEKILKCDLFDNSWCFPKVIVTETHKSCHFSKSCLLQEIATKNIKVQLFIYLSSRSQKTTFPFYSFWRMQVGNHHFLMLRNHTWNAWYSIHLIFWLSAG